MADVLLASGVLAAGVTYGFVLLLFLFWPLATWLAVRHLKGIRVELAELNATMARRSIVDGDTRVYTRTGSLNIR